MISQVETFLILIGVSVIITLGVIYFVLRYRMYAPGARYFLVAQLSTIMWHIGYFIELSGASTEVKILGAKIKYLGGVSFVPAFIFIAVLKYISYRQKPTTPQVAALLTVPFISAVLALTSGYHTLFFTFPPQQGAGMYEPLSKHPEFFFYVHMTYSYTLVIATYIILFRHFRNNKMFKGSGAATFMFMIMIPWFANMLYMFGKGSYLRLDYTCVSMSLSALILVLGIYKFGVLRLVSIAREKIIDELDNAVIVVDSYGRVLDYNHTAVTWLPEKIRPGDLIKEICTRNRLPGEIAAADKVLQFEYMGKIIQASSSELTPNPNVKGRLITLEDITGQKETENNLLKLAHQKDRFFSIIAHDLKNPFFALIGLSDLLYSDYENLTDKERRDIINKIHNISGSTYLVLLNLLDWSRKESGKIVFTPEHININQMINEVMNSLSGVASMKNVVLLYDSKCESNVFADSNMVRTILRNIISNAIKYSRKDGIITINCNTINNQTKVDIADTGTGMSAETIRKILYEKNTKSDLGTFGEEGSGLGLLLCKDFIRECGGKMTINSEKDRGSVVSFTLPASTVTSENKIAVTGKL